MVAFIELDHVPTRAELIENHPPSLALLILPGKAEDAYMPPHRLLCHGERETTLAQAMRPLIKKRKGEHYYEYDLHTVGVEIVQNEGLTCDPARVDKSFSLIYYLLGEGVYQQLVVPPIDPTLTDETKSLLQQKYDTLKDFLADENIEKLSASDKDQYLKGQQKMRGEHAN